jgi:hypothetical protein
MDQDNIPTKESFENSLFEHASKAASRAKGRLGSPLTPENLNTFLKDSLCLRFPTKIVFDRRGLEPHQFAQHEIVQENKKEVCVLHIDPVLKSRPEIIYLIVAYMAASINYGDVVTSNLCEFNGSLLTDMNQDEFYNKICQIADSIGLKENLHSE